MAIDAEQPGFVEYYREWKSCPYCQEGSFCIVCLGKGGGWAARLRPFGVGDATHHEGEGGNSLPTYNGGERNE